MSTNNELIKLSGILKDLKAKSRIDKSYTVISFPNELSINKKSEIEELLTAMGYRSSNDIFESDSEIWIDRAFNKWENENCILYSGFKSFWDRIYRTNSIPDNFIISFPLTFPGDNSDVINKIQVFFNWKIFLSLISDHQNDNYSILFISDEKSGTKFDLDFNIDFSTILELTNEKEKNSILHEIIELMRFSDLHQSDRKLIMRSAINEILKLKEKRDLLSLISSTESIRKKYDKLYEIYTKRFSVNKILNELDEKNLEFTAKINEFISSNQTKALTIPGALIAVGALTKADSIVESILIIIGLWMIKKVNNTSNSVFLETFNTLDARVSTAFSKYLKFEETIEIKENAIAIESNIKSLIKTAKKRLGSINKLASIMFYGGCIYIFYKQYPSYEKETHAIIEFVVQKISLILKQDR